MLLRQLHVPASTAALLHKIDAGDARDVHSCSTLRNVRFTALSPNWSGAAPVIGFADRHWAPGEGNIPWVAVFRALGRLTSNPRLILELRNHDARKGAAHLAALGLAE
ncbi:hypothetical protein FBZ94_101125 [Bradyrhizobium sacchari]|uniref:Uncharacterized protein n=1 Tax=Bradyrhizobium sacchari TaxID=1399419 RepID=A0A560J5E1_9BRAD|nr:hypothetical protein FBZ94_101125 [Bradyrhizobium sacchari]TWB83690.1 hypothetical protein FBZ95_101125 [Bradyrhizobium sacchari]